MQLPITSVAQVEKCSLSWGSHLLLYYLPQPISEGYGSRWRQVKSMLKSRWPIEPELMTATKLILRNGKGRFPSSQVHTGHLAPLITAVLLQSRLFAPTHIAFP